MCCYIHFCEPRYTTVELVIVFRPDGEMNDSVAMGDAAHGQSTFYNVSLNSESPEPPLPSNQRPSG